MMKFLERFAKDEVELCRIEAFNDRAFAIVVFGVPGGPRSRKASNLQCEIW